MEKKFQLTRSKEMEDSKTKLVLEVLEALCKALREKEDWDSTYKAEFVRVFVEKLGKEDE
jgi:hypothetical protein